MSGKGFGFVREPGLSPHELQQGQPAVARQMVAGVPKEDARVRLARQHDTMVGLWGPEYEKDPRYQQALSDVERGRHPTNVLADFWEF